MCLVIKRGRFLAITVLTVFFAGLVLAACGGEGNIGGGSSEDVETAKGGPIEGKWTISSWPLYIDSETVKDFDKEFGTETDYVEDVNDNDEFFGKMQPLLAEGKSGGRSAFVVTDWMVEKMRSLGYLQNIDSEAVPNVTANLLPSLAGGDDNADSDTYSIPYQAGMTGLIVNEKKAPDIRSIKDLFDPKYKGQVSMLTSMRSTLPLIVAAEGTDPKTADRQDWMDAIEKLKEEVDSGQIRAFYGNNYAAEFASGNVVAGLGWSGDVSGMKEDNPDLEFRMPTEGCVLWTDNFVIPVGSPNPAAALGFIDFVYRPEVAAQITDYVRYLSPVKGVQEVLEKDGSEVANDPFVFPDETSLDKCFPQTVVSSEDEDEVNRAYQQMMRG